MRFPQQLQCHEGDQALDAYNKYVSGGIPHTEALKMASAECLPDGMAAAFIEYWSPREEELK